MEPFFPDPSIERFLPPQVRILALHPEPWSGARLHLTIELTPFLQRPNLEITLTGPSAQVWASASILEPMAWKLELTLHLRPPGGTPPTFPALCTLTLSLSYPDLGETDRRQVPVLFPLTEEKS